MSERFSTAGMTLQYAVGTSNTTPPTSGYTKIPEIKSMPNFNPAPNTIDSTTLEETEYMTYVEGLKDLGGALGYKANLTDDLMTAWTTLLSAHDTAVSQNKYVWFAIVHPSLTVSTYYIGDPAPLGLDDAAVGGMLETTLYITPNSAPIKAAAPTPVNP